MQTDEVSSLIASIESLSTVGFTPFCSAYRDENCHTSPYTLITDVQMERINKLREKVYNYNSITLTQGVEEKDVPITKVTETDHHRTQKPQWKVKEKRECEPQRPRKVGKLNAEASADAFKSKNRIWASDFWVGFVQTNGHTGWSNKERSTDWAHPGKRKHEICH